MSVDPKNTVDHEGTDPNKGMRVKPYMAAVLASLVLLLIIIFVVAHRGSVTATPKTQPATEHSGATNPAPQ